MAEHLRILRCDQCRTLEEIPDFEGNPDDDHVLATLIDRRHTEHSGTTHLGQLMRVEKKHWESPSTRKEILRQLKEQHGGGNTGFDPEFYEARDTFKEDAATCFKKHNRNPNCGDYESDKMRLVPDTKHERKEAGMGRYQSAKDVYLCHFCPVQALVNNSRWEQAQKN